MRRGNDLNVFNVNLLNRMGERGNYEKYISFVFIFIMGVIFSLILVSSLILTGDTTYNSTNQNITNRAGRAWLNISDVSPYDSLVAYYPFDADNITNVTSGNPTTTYDFKGTNDGTYIGANITLSGVYDDAVSFDGVNDYVNTDSNFPIVGAQNRTMAVWFKTNYSAADRVVVSLGEFTGTTGGVFSLYLDNGGSRVRLDCKSCDRVWNFNYSDNKWHHFVVTLNGSTSSDLVGYMDGQELGVNSTVSATINTLNRKLYIGSYLLIGGAVGLFNGSIDEVMIFNTSLTAQQILDIYNNQSVRFVSAGEMLFQNNNIGVNNTINITLNAYENTLNSIIQAKVNNGNYVNFTNGGTLTDYLISGDTTNFNLTLRLVANTTQLNQSFYSPLLAGNISILSYLSDRIPPNVSLNAPANGFNTTSTNITFNFTAIDNAPANMNCSLYIDSVFQTGNGSVSNNTLTNLNLTNIVYGSHLWNVTCFDSALNSNTSSTRTFTLDNTAPNVTNIRFTGNTTDLLDPLQNITFNATVADDLFSVSSVVLQFYNSTNWINYTMSNITNTIYSANVTLPNLERNYTYNIWRNDSLGNVNITSNQTLEATWDCTWNVTPSDLGTTGGFFAKKALGNLTLQNTGDSQYSSGCVIKFSNWLTYTNFSDLYWSQSSWPSPGTR